MVYKVNSFSSVHTTLGNYLAQFGLISNLRHRQLAKQLASSQDTLGSSHPSHDDQAAHGGRTRGGAGTRVWAAVGAPVTTTKRPNDE